ncbi:MAG TPA: polysaccharide pyruvyl transferase family protein [Mycobacteriales bacterium]|nr:polysaccharide pyruvyl transferase family protein [Mycobacteriales bacterium]
MTDTKPTHVKPRGVLLVGAFGQRNPGDEALLASFRRALHDRPLTVASSDPARSESMHGIAAVNARSWREVARAVHRSAAVVMAGGTVFKTLPAETQRHPLSLLVSALGLSAYARAQGRPVLAVGVGVGRLDTPTAQLLARKVAAQCDLLVLRDSTSAHLLAAAGVPAPLRVAADPVWTLFDGVPKPARGDDRVVVVPSRWAVAEAPGHVEALADAVQPLLRHGTRVHVQPWQVGGSSGGPDDGAIARHLITRLGHGAELLPAPHEVTDAVSALSGARLVITSRFHAAVAAAAAGTATLVVAHEAKHTALAEQLDQPATSVWASPAELEAAVSTALGCAPPAAAAVRGEIAAAAEAFGLLRLMLAEGRQPVEDISGLRLEPAW